jgi:Tfp pilus assembly protein PilV
VKNNNFLSKRKSLYSGITLLETLVAIAIFAIGVEGFTILFSRSWKQNSYTIEMGQTAMATSQGVNRMVRYVREVRQGENGAYPVQSADDNDLVVFCDYNRDGIAERLHFYLSNGTLYMGIREPSAGFPKTYASGDGTIETIASHIVNTAAMPLFAYYDADYPEDSVNNPVATPATAPDVRLVKISIHMNIDPNRPPDNVQIESFAEMRNLNDHDRFGL